MLCFKSCVCPDAVLVYHFHRRNMLVVGGPAVWSDKNGGEYTRCCWEDPAVKDQEDAGSKGISAEQYFALQRIGDWIRVTIATEACTSPAHYLYSHNTHLLVEGGVNPDNCA